MKKFKDFLLLIVTPNSGISSKRVCGVLGFIVLLFTVIFCTVLGILAPVIIETFIWAICMLLGIDSVTDIFKLK